MNTKTTAKLTSPDISIHPDQWPEQWNKPTPPHKRCEQPKPEQLFERANQYKKQGLFPAAAHLYQQLLHSSPGHPEVSLNYGNLLQLEADYEPAIQVYQNALSKDPNHTLLLNGLGNAYCKTGQLEKAITPLKRATRVNPNDAISWFNLANVYFQMQRIERAQKCLNRAKKIRPKKLNFFHLAGEIEEQLGHWATALETYQHALDIDPDNPTTLHKLGRCYMENHRLTDARRTLEHCLARSPHYPLAWYHLGNALRSLGQLDAASAAYRNCLQQDAQHVEARLNLALSELQQHQWQRGWRNYEVRWKLPRYQHPYDALPLPRWRGQSLAGCGIVLWGEQGVGDEILFVRVAQDLAQHAKKVVVLCNPRLQSLLQRSLPGITVIAKTATLDPVQAIPHIHFHSPLASVMQYLPATAYLKPFSLRPNPHFTAQVPRRKHQLAIGISWHSHNVKSGPQRSVALNHWLPLLSEHKHRWVNVQAGSHQRALQNLARHDIRLYQDSSCDPLNDLDRFAALINTLDLVITIDNTTAHIAASLGVPTWILLPSDAEWRWGTSAHHCVWYPDAYLFRATSPGDWAPVFQAVTQKLNRLSTAPNP